MGSYSKIVTNYIPKEVYSGCYSDPTKLAVTSTVYSNFYDTEHRPKPKILRRNLTARTLVSRSEFTPTVVFAVSSGTSLIGGKPCSYTLKSYSTIYDAGFPGTDRIPFDQNMYNIRILQEVQKARARVGRTVAQLDKAVGILLSVARLAQMIVDCYKFPPSKKCAQMIGKALKCVAKLDSRCIGSAILGIDFGLKPLAASLYSLKEQLDAEPFLFVPFKFKQSAIHEYNLYGWQRREETSYRTSGNIVLKRPSGGFDCGNPELWTWERIPFSFVVDWMIPVGFYIASKSLIQEIDGIHGTITTRQEFTSKMTQLAYYYPGYFLKKHGERKLVRYYRTLAPVPGLPILFDYRPPKSYWSLLNACALLATVRSKRPF